MLEGPTEDHLGELGSLYKYYYYYYYIIIIIDLLVFYHECHSLIG